MYSLTKEEAILAVRQYLDELGPNDSVMYGDENADNLALDSAISKLLPEAINEIQSVAPASVLEGVSVLPSGDSQEEPIVEATMNNGVLSFTIKKRVLRIVAFRAIDSPIVVTETVAEDSPEGRKQLNKYIRGTYDKPCLVWEQGKRSVPSFAYYSLSRPVEGTAIENIVRLEIIEEQIYDENAESYLVSPDLRSNVLYHLTGMVLSTYGDERANNFFEKAK